MYGKVFVILLIFTLKLQLPQGNEELKFEKKWTETGLSSQKEDSGNGILKKALVLLCVCKHNSAVKWTQFDVKLCADSPKCCKNLIVIGQSSEFFKDAWVRKILWKCRHIFPLKKEKCLLDNSFVICKTKADGLILKTTSKLCKKYFLRTFFQIFKLISLKRYKWTSFSGNFKKEDIVLICDSRSKNEMTNLCCFWQSLCPQKNYRKKRKIRDITTTVRKLIKPNKNNVTKNSTSEPATKDKLNVIKIDKNNSSNATDTRNLTLKPVMANKVQNIIGTNEKSSVVESISNALLSTEGINNTEGFDADLKGNVTLFTIRKLRKIKSMADLKVVADKFKLNDTMILELKRELLLKYSKDPQWAFGCVVFIILLTLCAVHYTKIFKNCHKDLVIIDHKEVHYVYVNDLVKKRANILPHLKPLLGKTKKDKNRHIRRSNNIENFRNELENNEKQDSKSDWLPRKRGKSKRNVFSVLGKVFSSTNKKQRKLDKDTLTLPLLEEGTEDELYDIDEYSQYQNNEYSQYQNNSQDVGSSHIHHEDTGNAINVVTKRTVNSLAEDYGHSIQTGANSNGSVTGNHDDFKTYQTSAGTSWKNCTDLSVIKEI